MYKRRFSKKYSKKKRFGSRKRRIASKATLVNTVRTVVERDAEKKYWLLSYSILLGTHIPFGTSPQIICLTQPLQGMTDSERVGDRLKMNGLLLRLRCSIDPALGGASINFVAHFGVRCMVIQWLPSVSSIAPADLFDASPYHLSAIRWDNRQMCRVLMDKTFTMAQAQSNSSFNFKKYFSLRKSRHNQIQFQSASQTGTNKLFLVFMSNYSFAVANPSFMEINSRFTYTDS